MMMRGKKKVKKNQAGGIQIGPGGPTAAQRAASVYYRTGGRNAQFGKPEVNPDYDLPTARAVDEYDAMQRAMAAKQKASRSGGRGGGGASIIDRFRGALGRGFPQAKKKKYPVTVEELGNKKGGMIKSKSKSKKYGKGGKIDGCAMKGKTRGQMR